MKTRTKPNPVNVENHGTLALVRPLTKSAERWLRHHTDGMWFGGALVVEPRYVNDLLEGLFRYLSGAHVYGDGSNVDERSPRRQRMARPDGGAR